MELKEIIKSDYKLKKFLQKKNYTRNAFDSFIILDVEPYEAYDIVLKKVFKCFLVRIREFKRELAPGEIPDKRNRHYKDEDIILREDGTQYHMPKIVYDWEEGTQINVDSYGKTTIEKIKNFKKN